MTTIWKNDQNSSASAFFVTVTGLWVACMISIVLMGYRGFFFTEGISFLINDGHCNPEVHGFGDHCFGDFAYPFHSPESGYSSQDLVSVDTPVTLQLFRIFRLVPFNVALLTHVALSITGVLLILWHAIKRSMSLESTFLLAFVFLCSTGLIVSLDRGNRVIWLAPFAYVAMLAWRKDRMFLLAVCVVCSASLKWWGIAMVVLLFVSRRILLALCAIASTLVIHVAALALIPSGTFGGRLGDMLRDLTNTNYANRVSQSSVSLSSFVGRGICWVWPETVCGSGIFPRNVLPFNPAVFGILTSLVLLSIWLLTLWSYGKKDERVVVFFFAWLVLSIPESQSYNFVLLSAAFLVIYPCLIGRKDDHGSVSSGNNGLSLSKIPDVLLAVALATSLVPLPLFVSSSGVGFPLSLSGVGSTRWPLIVPGFWLLAFLAQVAKLMPGLMQSVARGASPLGRLRSRG